MPLLRSEEYVNDKGRRVVKEYYGKYDEAGNEIVTAIAEDEYPTEEELAEMNSADAVTADAETRNQLNRIEEAVKKSHEEIANEAIDAYTLELMNEGVI